MTEAQRKQFFEIRKALDSFVEKIVESPMEVNNNPEAIRTWTPNSYSVNDVRSYDGVPYKCVQAHDSTSNETWNPANTPSLWVQYHGTSLETARPWIAPTGAHDMYYNDEWMIWTDGSIYECIEDTVYDPSAYPQAWKKHTVVE